MSGLSKQRREEVCPRASWPHIDECREGMERLMMQDLTGADRAVRAKTLHEEALARHMRTLRETETKHSDGEAQLQRTRGDQPYSSVSLKDQQCCCHQRRTSATPHQPSRHTPFFQWQQSVRGIARRLLEDGFVNGVIIIVEQWGQQVDGYAQHSQERRSNLEQDVDMSKDDRKTCFSGREEQRHCRREPTEAGHRRRCTL